MRFIKYAVLLLLCLAVAKLQAGTGGGGSLEEDEVIYPRRMPTAPPPPPQVQAELVLKTYALVREAKDALNRAFLNASRQLFFKSKRLILDRADVPKSAKILHMGILENKLAYLATPPSLALFWDWDYKFVLSSRVMDNTTADFYIKKKEFRFKGRSVFDNIVEIKKYLEEEFKFFESDPDIYKALQNYTSALSLLEQELVARILQNFSKVPQVPQHDRKVISAMVTSLIESVQKDLDLHVIDNPLKVFFEKFSILEGKYSPDVYNLVYAALLSQIKILQNWPVSLDFEEQILKNPFILERQINDQSIELVNILLKKERLKNTMTIEFIVKNGSFEPLFIELISKNKKTKEYIAHINSLFKNRKWGSVIQEFRSLIDLYNKNTQVEAFLVKKTLLQRTVPSLSRMLSLDTSQSFKNNIKSIFLVFLENFSVTHFKEVEFFLNEFATHTGWRLGAEEDPTTLSKLAYEKTKIGLEIVDLVMNKIFSNLNSMNQFERIENSSLLTYDYETEGHANWEAVKILIRIREKLKDKAKILQMKLALLPSCQKYFP